MAETPKIKLQYFRSMICAPEKQKLTIKGLGFTRLNQIILREDTPSIHGMVKKVPHLVRIVEQNMVTLIVLVLNIWVAAYWLKSTMEGLQVELRSNIESLEDRLRRLEQSQTTSTELN